MATLLARRSQARAERLVQREYQELRVPTLRALRSRLSAQGIRFDDADLDEFYNQAWHGLYEQLSRGEEVENRAGFLVLVSYRRAIEELRRLHPERRADGVDAVEQAQEGDLAERLDDRRRLREAMEGMRERLSARELQAAALCYLHGYTRPEAAEALGLPPRRMEKLMDGVSSKLGAVAATIDAGEWCRSRQSLMKAYAYGVLDPDGERCALARAHLEECSSCRNYVRGLRGISAVVPPVWIPLLGLGTVGLGGAAAAVGSAQPAAGGGSGGGLGGTAGGWGVPVAAGLAVAAGAIGTWAIVAGAGNGDSGALPARRASPPAAIQASAEARAAKVRRRRARRSAASRSPATASSRSSARGAGGGTSTPTQAPTTQPTSSAPVPSSAPAPAAAPRPAPQPQEFGFER